MENIDYKELCRQLVLREIEEAHPELDLDFDMQDKLVYAALMLEDLSIDLLELFGKRKLIHVLETEGYTL